MTPSPLLRRIFVALAFLGLSALAGLAMATPLGAAGANLVGRWLVGWAAAAVVLLPVAWVAGRAAQRARRPARSPALRPFHSRRLG